MTTKEKMFNDNIGLVHKVINDNFACFKKGEFYGDLFDWFKSKGTKQSKQSIKND